MAVTGAVLLVFVVTHMLANLKIFVGATALDGYGRWLHSLAEPALGHDGFVWIARVVLLLCVALHITAAVQLTRRAHRARPFRYRHRRPVLGGYAARTMRWGGVVIALFVVYHVLDMTVGVLNPNGIAGQDYRDITASFGRWYAAAFTMIAVLALGPHIRHGLCGALRSLGVPIGRGRRVVDAVAIGVAVTVTAGFLSVPLAVLTGMVR